MKPGPKRDTINEARALRMACAGARQVDIAARCGVSQATVSKWLQRAGFPVVRVGSFRESRAQLRFFEAQVERCETLARVAAEQAVALRKQAAIARKEVARLRRIEVLS